jgi:aldose 1-epimerase
MTAITLANPTLRLVVDPASGMNLYAFSVFQGNAWLPVMPDTTGTRGRPSADLKESSFVMVPYSNRIEDGRFAFAGKAYQLQNGERHAIHGDVRSRAWQVEEADGQRLRASFDSRRHENVNWPWPFAATLEYALADYVLASRMTLQNLGDSAMPAGFGWHPYYSRWLTRQDEAVHLQFAVAGVYPDANNNRIPSGPGQPPAAHQDFRREKALPPDLFLDMCCYGYDGNGSISWPESGVKLVYRCSAECTHLVMYNPARPYFAVEPVTNANNGVNLLAEGDTTSGVHVLQPGETLDASFDVLVELT